ncbi:MAG: substrate-binding domain-containing protein, partial [Bacteroidota bacterium]
GVKRAVEYLTLRNEKNLLLIKNDMWKGRNLLHELMEQTFRNVLDEEFPGRNHFVASDISEITQKTLNKYNIGGILCCYDTDAIKITGRLKKWNLKIPDDISVVAYGNTELIELFTPSITAIDCKYNEIASITAGLIDKGKACSDNEQYVIQPELIIRET